MRAKTSTENFEERIEQLVREHILAIRARAEAAVARGFAESAARSSRLAAPQTKLSVPRPASRRRTTEQVADLAERLCAAVHAAPGETMLRLAPQVGATPGELSIAATRLRQQGRVRTVGQRQHTRYFPTAPASARAA
jgi:predicted amidophosphoribosyltransferase